MNAVPQPVRNVLDGVWFGNPLHPALTDVPLGAWTTALVLDLAGSEAADSALAVGILGAAPAALTGLNDWSHLKDDERRIGIVHALLNTMGLALNVASLVAGMGIAASVASSPASPMRAPRFRPISAAISRSDSVSASTGPRSRPRVTATRPSARRAT